MIDQIENFMNDLTDMDWGWWPVLFLRPAKDKDIDNIILFKLSLAFGTFIAVFLWACFFIMTHVITFGSILFFVLTGWLLFFVIYKVTFVYFWNRRARRLRSGQ